MSKQKQPRARRIHSEEFKREAVKLVTEHGYSVAEAARNLDVGQTLLRRWRAKYAADDAVSGELTEDERQELARLRAENARLRMEREILKKATAFFASEKP